MSNTVKAEAESEATASATAMAVSSNAAPTLASGKTDPNINYKDEDDESEDVDDEEALLVALEVEKEKEHAEESAHPNEQPKDVAAAPRILQDALKQGLVTASDSEEEEIKKERENKAVASNAAKQKKLAMAKEAMQEEKKGDDEPVAHGGPHLPCQSKCHTPFSFLLHMLHRLTISFIISFQANQLDFLLSKASEYSNFIAKDLEQLQAEMTEQAELKVKSAEKTSKKGKKRTSKKAKREESAAALKSAQKKDAEVRAGGARTIFVQPQNLSDGCVLKDYQLEGVRWLSSLFENGVSGILAGTFLLTSCVFHVAQSFKNSQCSFFKQIFRRRDGFGKNDSSDCLDWPPLGKGCVWTVHYCGTSCDTTQLGP